MRKIGIVTLNGYFNYGNRLQNYALQNAIESLGFEVETIINNTYIDKNSSNMCNINENKILKFIKKDFNSKVEVISKKLNKKKLQKLQNQRSIKFQQFSKKYINETKFSISLGNVSEKLECDYEYFIAGSDQVWNPNDPMVSELNFMTFAPKNKRITYAPSFGVSNIPEEYKEDFKIWLSGIDNISVREEAGAKIVKELTGKDSSVHIDPTMLLTKEKWLEISYRDNNKPNGKYLLTYFLGDITEEVNNKIKSIAVNNNLEIVNLASIKDKKHYITGPSEFIDYINDSEIFITDSFHGCVFSVLLETPFIVCDRAGQGENKMNSRIETFLQKFKLENRKFEKVTTDILFEKDYKLTMNILAEEREKAWKYLKERVNCNS